MSLPFDNEHVQYEFAMLKMTYEQTQKFGDYWGQKQTGIFNVMHESFCVHAWNLINWFDGPDPDIEDEYFMIENQVLSLGLNRTGEFSEKINIKERDTLYNWIMAKKQDQYPTKVDSLGRVLPPRGESLLEKQA